MSSRSGGPRRARAARWLAIVAAVVVVAAGIVIGYRALRATPTVSGGTGPKGTTSPTSVLPGFPTRTSVGLPSGWKPAREVTGNLRIDQAGAVVEDLRITNGTIEIDAPNVTLRRIQGVGAFVATDSDNACSSGLVIEDSEFTPGAVTSEKDPPVIGQGGFTVRRTVIDGVPEGIRSGASDIGCGPITVEDTYVRIISPDDCNDWHGDGIQGYGGAAVTVRNSTLIMDVRNQCYGTAPFFYPKDQGNTSVDIDGLLVSGGGYPFRNGMPGTVKDLDVVDGGWVFAPVDVNCAVVTSWQAKVVTLHDDGTVTPVRDIPCEGDGG